MPPKKFSIRLNPFRARAKSREPLWKDFRSLVEKYVGKPGKWKIVETPREIALRFLVEKGSIFAAYPLDPGFAINMTIGKAILDEVEKISPKIKALIARATRTRTGVKMVIPVRSRTDLKLVERILALKVKYQEFRARKKSR